jgi:DNA-binding response OmpR family regulator
MIGMIAASVSRTRTRRWKPGRPRRRSVCFDDHHDRVAYCAIGDIAPQTGSAILVVEDEAHIRDLMVGELTAHGYTCVAASGVANAAARLRERPFSLIVLDLILRDGSGLDLLPTIQETPVLVVSGSPTSTLREAAAARSVRGLLTKPFSLPELRDKVAHCLTAGADRPHDTGSGGPPSPATHPFPAPTTATEIGTVTHALKNLLAIAIGEVEFLLSEEAQDDPCLRRECLESIRRVVLDSRQLIWRLEGVASPTPPSVG